MSTILRLTERGVLVALMVLLLTEHAESQEIINRRQQARGIVLATPQGVYGHYCAHCHGEGGKGDGRLWPADLSPAPADLTVLERSEKEIVATIRSGSSLCPPWERTLSSPDIQRLARYLVSLTGKTPQASAPAAPKEPRREPFPWVPVVALCGEVLALWRLFGRRRKAPDVLP